MESTRTPSVAAIHEQLERVLASAPFANAPRSQKFLRYIVESTLNNQDEFLKEFTIAVDVYGRNVSYDPSINATVRVEAGRIRSRLREYYTGIGRNDPVIIDVPKGGYRVTFEQRLPAGRVVPEPSQAPASPVTAERRRSAWIAWLAIAAILILTIVGLALWARSPHASTEVIGRTPDLSSSTK